MDRDSLDEHLSRISTLWSMIFQAHDPEGDAATAAQRVLLLRYSGAAYRYLLGALRDPDAAADLAQEFAVRFLRGQFRRADPGRGRFRDYLKTALSRLVTDHYRARQGWPQALSPDGPEPAAPSASSADDDRAFLAGWREELLERTWQALADANPTFHAVLRLRSEQPDLPSPRMAEELTARLGREVNAAWGRKTLQRAQGKFADLLLDEVAVSLEEATPEALRQELEATDLLRYCRSALARRHPAAAGGA